MSQQTDPAASPSPWRLFAAVLAAPAAWTLQVCIAEALVAQSCFPHDAPTRASYADAALAAAVGVSVAALAVGAAGTWCAWRNWRRLAQRMRASAPRGAPPIVSGEAFIAEVGFMASVLFLFALVATDIASMLVSACG
ncbi:hypothetical protein WKR88_08945 [Trinickia caryophylli]|uniref:Uncharacterized protein n=1 Tax=Trinickia caryophylli TaxID=28094 RepID=A0A1X7EBZ3_TRICW|nr:hypothetical protein [Trinickia caryophylli]TRX14689.1 hypothetical protein FNF07_25930 [Trinickia caryophylli]WQE14532.1 hypothetical protein U0034_28120 [Trinickia caryophylli]GLU32061.1 hypothetical protein Busp01_19030 [Trinickia caryophylli]SMF31272.1 hypothetical protein SAMN06295900_105176 [Trinickia caryophylli]